MTLEERLIKKTAIGSTLFAIGASIILFQLPNQAMVETVMKQTSENHVQNSKTSANYFDKISQAIKSNEGVKSYLSIPLPDDVKEDDITIENSYIDQTILITIDHVDEKFFDDNKLKGSSDHISDIVYGSSGGLAKIELDLDSVYEYHSEMVDNSLNLSFITPKSMYDKIVVIDAGHGGRDNGTEHYNIAEKEINLDIVLKLKELLDKSDIKAYYTRLDDTKPSNASRVNLANSVDADFFISVHNNGDRTASSSAGTEVLYHDTEQDKEYGSKWLAQLCQDELIKQLGSRDRGLVSGSDIKIIRLSNVPAALVEVGFITNKSEARKLGNDSYQEKAAKGIFNAIKKAYEEINK